MPRTIDQIKTDAGKSLEQLLTEAFEAGRVVGREESAAEFREFRNKLAHILDAEPVQAGPIAMEHQAGGRATPGSVKPAILNLIIANPGLSQDEIQQKTGFKPNSVRGTLWTLSAQDKAIHKVSGYWYPGPEKEEPAGTPSQDAPTGSIRRKLFSDE